MATESEIADAANRYAEDERWNAPTISANSPLRTLMDWLAHLGDSSVDHWIKHGDDDGERHIDDAWSTIESQVSDYIAKPTPRGKKLVLGRLV